MFLICSRRENTITDRYAPLHQTVIAGTAGEAVNALDGILGHEAGVDVSALHVDGGGVSDIKVMRPTGAFRANSEAVATHPRSGRMQPSKLDHPGSRI